MISGKENIVMLSKQHMVKVRTKMLVYALFIQDQTDFRGIK